MLRSFAPLLPLALAVTLLGVPQNPAWAAAPFPSDAKDHPQITPPSGDPIFTNASRIREQSLQLLDGSRQRAGKDFAPLTARLDEKLRFFLEDSLTAIDFSTKEGRSRSVWALSGRAANLQGLGIALNLPESSYSQNEAGAEFFRQAASSLLDHFREGSIPAEDPNVDRFVLPPFFDAMILAWPLLDDNLRSRFVKTMREACDHQRRTYADTPVAGQFAGYPNMDAAYLLILRQTGELLDDDDLRAQSVERTRLLGLCFSGSTYDYITGWPPDPSYTNIVLSHLGRYWQMSGDEEALRQISRHQDYYKWFLEPGGQMDYGISPPIKHMWHMQPYGTCNPGLELVQAAAPSKALQNRVADFRTHLLTARSRIIHPLNFFWFAEAKGEGEPMPTNFLRPSPEAAGWQMRQTTDLGTWTAWLFGRQAVLDTRVSALGTPAQTPPNAVADTITATGIAGVFLELFQNGHSYFLGEMTPHVESRFDEATQTATLIVTQKRKSFGADSRPMKYGRTVGKRTTGAWSGGMPEALPLETVEKWTLSPGQLSGTITVTALEECLLEDVRLSVIPVLPRVDEKQVRGQTAAARYGTLCASLTVEEGAWTPEVDADDSTGAFHFRADLPNGVYDITLTSGDERFPTAPFSIEANGQDTGVTVSAETGQFVSRTFRVPVREGRLELRFRSTPLAHWKVNAIEIVRATDGAPFGNFDVGPADEPAAPDYQRLSGRDVYQPEKGFGWSRDYTSQERTTRQGGSLHHTLITSDDPGRVLPADLVLKFPSRGPQTFPAGTRWQARITIRQAASLDQFLSQP